MENELSQENGNEDQADFDNDWDNRILCSDGNCIGVIGADGRCKECGRTYEGPLPEPSALEQADQADQADQVDQVVGEDKEMTAAADESNSEPVAEYPADEDWGNRVLCRDGNCIGVIGSDGRCKECGKPYE